MFQIVTRIRGISVYSQSKFYKTPKLERESHADYEARTWRDRMHVNEDGNVIIPSMSLKNCLDSGAREAGIKVPGGGQKRYTGMIEKAVMVLDPVVLPIKAIDVPGDWVFVPSDGIRGGGKRVEKCFGIIPIGWGGDVTWTCSARVSTNVAVYRVDGKP
jgi:hypothetical protein